MIHAEPRENLTSETGLYFRLFSIASQIKAAPSGPPMVSAVVIDAARAPGSDALAAKGFREQDIDRLIAAYSSAARMPASSWGRMRPPLYAYGERSAERRTRQTSALLGR